MLKTVGNLSTRYGNQTIIDGNLIIGTAGKGIDFSANANAPGMTSELLNWYEEGQYTATLTPSASGSISLYETAQTLQYTRIGRLVTVTGGVQVSGVSSPTGYIKLNLPFNVSNLTQQSSRVTGSIVVDASAVANANDFVLYATNGATTVDIYLGTGTALSATSANSIGTNSQLIFAFTYIAA